MIDLHDSSEIEAQLLWVIKLASLSSPAQLDSTVSEKSARLFLDSWFQKREASLDFVEDLLWNVFYQSSDKNIGFLHIPRIVFQYVSEKMETAELVPVVIHCNILINHFTLYSLKGQIRVCSERKSKNGSFNHHYPEEKIWKSLFRLYSRNSLTIIMKFFSIWLSVPYNQSYIKFLSIILQNPLVARIYP
jgi:hypothetical protein